MPPSPSYRLPTQRLGVIQVFTICPPLPPTDYLLRGWVWYKCSHYASSLLQTTYSEAGCDTRVHTMSPPSYRLPTQTLGLIQGFTLCLLPPTDYLLRGWEWHKGSHYAPSPYRLHIQRLGVIQGFTLCSLPPTDYIFRGWVWYKGSHYAPPLLQTTYSEAGGDTSVHTMPHPTAYLLRGWVWYKGSHYASSLLQPTYSEAGSDTRVRTMPHSYSLPTQRLGVIQGFTLCLLPPTAYLLRGCGWYKCSHYAPLLQPTYTDAGCDTWVHTTLPPSYRLPTQRLGVTQGFALCPLPLQTTYSEAGCDTRVHTMLPPSYSLPTQRLGVIQVFTLCPLLQPTYSEAGCDTRVHTMPPPSYSLPTQRLWVIQVFTLCPTPTAYLLRCWVWHKGSHYAPSLLQPTNSEVGGDTSVHTMPPPSYSLPTQRLGVIQGFTLCPILQPTYSEARCDTSVHTMPAPTAYLVILLCVLV